MCSTVPPTSPQEAQPMLLIHETNTNRKTPFSFGMNAQTNLNYFIIAISGIVSWTVAIIIILRKKRKKQPDPNNDQMP